MLITILFIVAKIWKQPWYLSAGKWRNKILLKPKIKLPRYEDI